jgi:hypothetical protein
MANTDTANGAASACVLVPRWGGKSTSDWYPWFVDQVPDVQVLSGLPKNAPPEAWKDAVATALPSNAEALSSTVVVTHSLAMHGLIQALDANPSGAPLKGAVLVAAWWDIDRGFWDRIGEPWSAIEPWLDYAFDPQVVQRRLGSAIALIGDNDPIVSSPADVTADRLRSRLSCQVRICPDRQHFNQAEEPDVLQALQGLR